MTKIHWCLEACLPLAIFVLGIANAQGGDLNTEVLTITGGCYGDLAASALACTATDVQVSTLAVDEIQDECDFPGDTSTVQLAISLQNNTARYDLGVSIALDGGDGLNGHCAISSFPETSPFADLDTTQSEDLCGDIGTNGEISNVSIPSEITIPCIDRDRDGQVDVFTCSSWANNDTALCLTPSDTVPANSARCHCTLTNITGLPVPPGTLEVRKSLSPASDPGRFKLLIDGINWSGDIGDQGTTGPIWITDHTHFVKEEAGEGTELDDYSSSIECLDTVGRCVDSSGTHCLSDAMCASAGKKGCNLAPSTVASCDGCTALNFPTPNQMSATVCTITNVANPVPLFFEDGFETLD